MSSHIVVKIALTELNKYKYEKVFSHYSAYHKIIPPIRIFFIKNKFCFVFVETRDFAYNGLAPMQCKADEWISTNYCNIYLLKLKENIEH